MKLIEQFKQYAVKNQLFDVTSKVLLAVSGGKDSMLMLYLFHTAGIAVEIAHCNFNLRGKESDDDEALVRSYASLLAVPIHVQSFDTVDYAEKKKVSIQVAARELRYRWFGELAMDRKCTVISVAQHMNDHVETVLFNLTRGTGLLGLQGILPKRGNIIRPLLFLTANAVASHVSELQIPFRDDSSNFSTKYSRNKIRLDIIPEFEKLRSDFVRTMNENISRFQDSQHVLQDYVRSLRKDNFLPKDDYWLIECAFLERTDLSLLYFLFEPFGFSKAVLEDVKASLGKESGRVFSSSSYELLLDRGHVVLKDRIMVAGAEGLFVSADDTKVFWNQCSFSMSESEELDVVNDRFTAKFDVEKLIFPLQIRSWQQGDRFRPLGMKGMKKLSDLFISKKINIFDKEKIAIWLNGNGDIIWVTGLQMDDRYKITKNTQKVLTLVLQNNGE